MIRPEAVDAALDVLDVCRTPDERRAVIRNVWMAGVRAAAASVAKADWLGDPNENVMRELADELIRMHKG